MPRYTGKDLWVGLIHASGTAVLTGNGRNFEYTHEQMVANMTAQADEYEQVAATVKKWSGKMEQLYTGTSGTAMMAAVDVGDTGTLLWAPLGTTAGLPKGGIPVLVTKADRSFPYDEAIKIATEFQATGDLTYDENTATW